MEHLLLGSATLIVTTLLFFLAAKQYQQAHYNWALCCILLVGLVLRIFVAADPFLHPWDERYHALVAKNLIAHPFRPMLYVTPLLDYDYTNWTNNHIWVHKQPVPLYSMALSMWLFGKHLIAMRLPSILLSTLTIFTTFRIGTLLFSKRVGFGAAFFCAINGLVLELTSGRVATDHIDLFFYAWVALGVYFALLFAKEDKWYWLVACGIATGLAILSKWLPALIVLPLWGLAMFHFREKPWWALWKTGVLLILIIIMVALPWQLYIYTYFPKEAASESAYNWKHIFEVLGPHGHPFYYHFDVMRIIFGELVYIPLLWLLYRCIKSRFAPRFLLLVTWILVPYIFFSLVKTKMQAYTLFTGPAFFVLTALFIDLLHRKKQQWYPTIANVLILLLIALPVRYSVERIKPFAERPQPAWIKKVKTLEESLPRHNKKVIFNCRYSIETMFHTDMIAYPTLPPYSKIKTLQQAGFSIFIDHATPLSAAQKKWSDVTFIQVSNPEE